MISTDKSSDKYIEVNSVGIQETSGKRDSCLRKDGRLDHHILYIKEGFCQITENGKSVRAEAGSLVYYPPKVRQEYCYTEECKSIAYYLHFTGTESDKIVKNIGLFDKRIIFVGRSSEITEAFDSLILERSTGGELCELMTSARLINLLGVIGRRIASGGSEDIISSKNKIAEIKAEMFADLREPKRIGEYAEMCNLSESRFSHLFKEVTGLSPIQYINDLRYRHARELLEYTDMPVSIIADRIGIRDTNYFSRFFKERYGISPLGYRKLNSK